MTTAQDEPFPYLVEHQVSNILAFFYNAAANIKTQHEKITTIHVISYSNTHYIEAAFSHPTTHRIFLFLFYKFTKEYDKRFQNRTSHDVKY